MSYIPPHLRKIREKKEIEKAIKPEQEKDKVIEQEDLNQVFPSDKIGDEIVEEQRELSTNNSRSSMLVNLDVNRDRNRIGNGNGTTKEIQESETGTETETEIETKTATETEIGTSTRHSQMYRMPPGQQQQLLRPRTLVSIGNFLTPVKTALSSEFLLKLAAHPQCLNYGFHLDLDKCKEGYYDALLNEYSSRALEKDTNMTATRNETSNSSINSVTSDSNYNGINGDNPNDVESANLDLIPREKVIVLCLLLSDFLSPISRERIVEKFRVDGGGHTMFLFNNTFCLISFPTNIAYQRGYKKIGKDTNLCKCQPFNEVDKITQDKIFQEGIIIPKLPEAAQGVGRLISSHLGMRTVKRTPGTAGRNTENINTTSLRANPLTLTTATTTARRKLSFSDSKESDIRNIKEKERKEQTEKEKEKEGGAEIGSSSSSFSPLNNEEEFPSLSSLSLSAKKR